MQVGQTPHDRDAVEQDKTDDEVGAWPGEEHRDALPHLLAVHRVLVVLGCELLDASLARRNRPDFGCDISPELLALLSSNCTRAHQG